MVAITALAFLVIIEAVPDRVSKLKHSDATPLVGHHLASCERSMPTAVHIPKRWWPSKVSTLPVILLTRTTQYVQLDRHLVAQTPALANLSHRRNVVS